jgi:hypothetical protein
MTTIVGVAWIALIGSTKLSNGITMLFVGLVWV